MNFQSTVMFFCVFLCAHQRASTRHASLNIGLNISAHFSDENNQLSQQLIQICMKETQLSMADLYRFKANEIQETDVTESTQCFAHCIYEQMGFMNNGLFVDNDDSQKSALNGATGGGDFVVCKAIRGQNKCDTAYKIHQCIQKVKFGGALRDPTLTLFSETKNNSGNDETNDEDDSNESQN